MKMSVRAFVGRAEPSRRFFRRSTFDRFWLLLFCFGLAYLALLPLFRLQQAALEDGDYTVDHSTVVLVIDPEGRFRALFSSPHSIDGFVHDLPLIMAMQ